MIDLLTPLVSALPLAGAHLVPGLNRDKGEDNAGWRYATASNVSTRSPVRGARDRL